MVRQFLIALGLVALAASTVRGQDRPNTLTQKEAAEGWVLLFDGKSLDGWETHGTRLAFEEDRRRRNYLVLAGYAVLNFTYRQLVEEPQWVIDCIRHATR